MRINWSNPLIRAALVTAIEAVAGVVSDGLRIAADKWPAIAEQMQDQCPGITPAACKQAWYGLVQPRKVVDLKPFKEVIEGLAVTLNRTEDEIDYALYEARQAKSLPFYKDRISYSDAYRVLQPLRQAALPAPVEPVTVQVQTSGAVTREEAIRLVLDGKARALVVDGAVKEIKN